MTPLPQYTHTIRLFNLAILLTFPRGCRNLSLSVILMAALLPVTLKSQNIFDESHSREYAQHLMQSFGYQQAAAEWERVLFLSPNDSIARLNLIKSLRLADQPAAAWKKLNQWYPSAPLTRQFSIEAAQITLMQSDFTALDSVIKRSPGLAEAEKSTLRLGGWLMEGKWINQSPKTRKPTFTVASMEPRLLDTYSKAMDVHRKSPAAAVALSLVIPGMGKIYSHDWKDGLMSLLFVATSAYQCYRGFSKNGTGSITGWVFGGLAVGFYTANLFGSWKSANLYNSNQTDRIRHEAESILITH